MNAIGIIAEYNPFHLGHLHQLNELKKEYPNTPIIVLMSGSFVQRGEPALFDKFKRSRWAILNGADLVIELPSFYALSNAEQFAKGGMKLLASLNISHCSFGAETADLNQLTNTAKALLSPEIDNYCQEFLAKGWSYATALRRALEKVSPGFSKPILNPNNLLGIEYIKATIENDLPIEFIPITRTSAHHDLTLSSALPSGTAIRRVIATMDTTKTYRTLSDINSLSTFLPIKTFSEIKDALIDGDYVSYNRYGDSILLAGKLSSAKALSSLQDFEEGLENAWLKAMTKTTWDDALNALKSRRYTFSRLRRMASYTLLNRDKITSKKVQEAPAQYARVLAFSDKGRAWLKEAKTSIPLVTKWGAFYKKTSGIAKIMADADILATNIQAFCMHNPNHRNSDKDYLHTVFYNQNELK